MRQVLLRLLALPMVVLILLSILAGLIAIACLCMMQVSRLRK